MTRRGVRHLCAVAVAVAAALVALLAALLAFPAGAAAPQNARSQPTRQPVAVLMYHAIARPPAGVAYPRLYVPRTEFSAQVRWLASRGFRAVTLKQVYDAWHGRGRLPRRPIVLSFDDGYRSHYTNARAVLLRHGWPGVLNLEVAKLFVPSGIAPRQVRGLIRAGWEIDAHTVNHADLRFLDDRTLAQEVAGSRWKIRQRFRVPVDFFCYPAGLYDARVIEAVRKAGFIGATTVRFGLAEPSQPFALARVRVDGGDGAAGLRGKLAALGLG